MIVVCQLGAPGKGRYCPCSTGVFSPTTSKNLGQTVEELWAGMPIPFPFHKGQGPGIGFLGRAMAFAKSHPVHDPTGVAPGHAAFVSTVPELIRTCVAQGRLIPLMRRAFADRGT